MSKKDTPKQELRSESRWAEQTSIYVQAYSTPDGKQDPAAFKVTKTVDISTKGIQIQLDMRVPVKSVLQLRLHTKDRPKPYLLTGEVRWTYQDHVDPKRHFVGFRLLEDGQTDNREWQSYVNSRFKK